MTLTTGFFKLDRGILKYFEKPFSEIEAWIWMISQAEYNGDGRGRIKGTMRQFGDAWGKDKKTVSRWLKKWGMGNSPRISICYARCNAIGLGATKNVTEGATGRATGVTEITLLNYDKYQTIPKGRATGGATVGATETGTLLKEEEKKRKNKSTPLPPKDLEVIKSELEKVDLPKLRQKFPQKDVNATWEEFYECCISGIAKKPKPNPYDYVDFEKGFLTWLRRRPDIANTKDTSWDTEY